MLRVQHVVLLAAALVLLAGCGVSSQVQTPVKPSQPTSAPAAAGPTALSGAATATEAPAAGSGVMTGAAPAPTSTPAPQPAPAVATVDSAAAATPAPAVSGSTETIRLVLQPDSQVSYRVREQLARVKLPSDAVGTTKEITGSIAIQSDGQIVADQSKFVVDLDTLKSDSGMRDGYIKRNTLQTNTYPEAVFIPTAIEGLSSPLPQSGEINFKVIGDLTVRGITKQVTWDVQGKVAGNELTGTAKTSLKFGDFGMTPPTTMMALSVEDNIGLETNFHLVAANP